MLPMCALINMLPEPGSKKREPQAGELAMQTAQPTEEKAAQETPPPLDKAPDPPKNREALGRSRGGLTSKLHILCDAKSRPLALHLTAGQVNESTQAGTVLDKVRVPRAGRGAPRKRPSTVLMDKGYGGKPVRHALRDRGVRALIPTKERERAARVKRGANGGRPYWFDKEGYKRRNVVERCINRLKHFRRVATRYDKRAESYLAFVTFASILLWMR